MKAILQRTHFIWTNHRRFEWMHKLFVEQLHMETNTCLQSHDNKGKLIRCELLCNLIDWTIKRCIHINSCSWWETLATKQGFDAGFTSGWVTSTCSNSCLTNVFKAIFKLHHIQWLNICQTICSGVGTSITCLLVIRSLMKFSWVVASPALQMLPLWPIWTYCLPNH